MLRMTTARTVALAILVPALGVVLSIKACEDGKQQRTAQALVGQLQTSCDADADCKQYILASLCMAPCGNRDEANGQVALKAEGILLCDPTLWDPPLELGCRCIDHECQHGQNTD